eukprot:jgi/Bigna1/138559/aug1.45_g13267
MQDCEVFVPELEDIREDYEEKLKDTPRLRRQLNQELRLLSSMVSSTTSVNLEEGLSIDDITLFSALRPLTLIKGIRFGEKLDVYMRQMSKRADVPLYTSSAM